MGKSENSFLIDTSVFIWWINESRELSLTAQEIISNPKNVIILSAISGWEISIKAKLGRLKEVGDPELSVPFQAKRNSFLIQDFPMAAALKVFSLPDIHQDPFDRALIAHAKVLDIPIVTADKVISKYDLEVVW
jgi:PIN domain nuclease of toxin-antitoxin system